MSDVNLSSSSTVSKAEGTKKVHEISSRLLQNTASSSARSGFTPTLTRKFGGGRPGSDQKVRRTPNNALRFGSGRKEVRDGKSVKIVTSSAKKLVLNSTSEAENAIPTDWDASAIIAPGLKDKPMQLMKKTAPQISDTLKLKTGNKVTVSNRGPLKALPNSGNVVYKSSPVMPPIKRLQLFTASNTSISNDNEALYDEYLLSKLMASNVKQNCQAAKNQANKELVNMWTALEHLRGQVLAQEKMNEEMKSMCKFYKEASQNVQHLQTSTEVLKTANLEVTQVAEALENTRHNLPVKGAKVDDNIETILEQNLKPINGMAGKAAINKDIKHKVNKNLDKLGSSLEITSSASRSCSDSLNNLKTEALKETSLKLSQIQLTAPDEDHDLTDNLLKIPPEPKLIEF